MDGNDLHRSIGRHVAGKAARESLEALARQAAAGTGTAEEIARARRAATPGPEDRSEASRRVEREHR